MKNETKNAIKDCFIESTGREPLLHEEINMEKDVGLIVPFLIEKVEELEDRIKKLEK